MIDFAATNCNDMPNVSKQYADVGILFVPPMKQGRINFSMQFTLRKIFSLTTAIAVSLGTLLIVSRNFQSPFINIPIGILAVLGIYCSPIALPLLGFFAGRYVLKLEGMDMLAFVFIFVLLGPVFSILCYYLLGIVIGMNEQLVF